MSTTVSGSFGFGQVNTLASFDLVNILCSTQLLYLNPISVVRFHATDVYPHFPSAVYLRSGKYEPLTTGYRYALHNVFDTVSSRGLVRHSTSITRSDGTRATHFPRHGPPSTREITVYSRMPRIGMSQFD